MPWLHCSEVECGHDVALSKISRRPTAMAEADVSTLIDFGGSAMWRWSGS
jgi:hypothetical protein